MSNTVKPKFNFSGNIPIEGSGGTHISSRQLNNSLRPILFNEYERVIVTLANLLGNCDFSEMGSVVTDPRIGQTIKSLYNYITTELDGKFSTEGGPLFGPITAVAGGIVSDAIAIPWKQHTDYLEHHIVNYYEGLYRCTADHRSSISFADGYWEPLKQYINMIYELRIEGHDLLPGEVINPNPNDGTWVRSLANDIAYGGYLVIESVVDANTIRVAQHGIIEFPVGSGVTLDPFKMYYVSETNAGELTTTEPSISQPAMFSLSSTMAMVLNWQPQSIASGYNVTYTVPDPTVGVVKNIEGVYYQDSFEVPSINHRNYLTWVSIGGVDQPSSSFNFTNDPYPGNYAPKLLDGNDSGTILYLASEGEDPDITGGYLYKSIDYGINWIRLDSVPSSKNWVTLKTNDSGSIVIAMTAQYSIYVSTDYGVNFSIFTSIVFANPVGDPPVLTISRDSGNIIVGNSLNLYIINPSTLVATNLSSTHLSGIRTITPIFNSTNEFYILYYNDTMYYYNGSTFTECIGFIDIMATCANVGDKHITATKRISDDKNILCVGSRYATDSGTFYISDDNGVTFSNYNETDTDNYISACKISKDAKYIYISLIGDNILKRFGDSSSNYNNHLTLYFEPIDIYLITTNLNTMYFGISTGYGNVAAGRSILRSLNGADFSQVTNGKKYITFVEPIEEDLVVNIKAIHNIRHIPSSKTNSNIYTVVTPTDSFDILNDICEGELLRDKDQVFIYIDGIKLTNDKWEFGSGTDEGTVILDSNVDGVVVEIICMLSNIRTVFDDNTVSTSKLQDHSVTTEKLHPNIIIPGENVLCTAGEILGQSNMCGIVNALNNEITNIRSVDIANLTSRVTNAEETVAIVGITNLQAINLLQEASIGLIVLSGDIVELDYRVSALEGRIDFIDDTIDNLSDTLIDVYEEIERLDGRIDTVSDIVNSGDITFGFINAPASLENEGKLRYWKDGSNSYLDISMATTGGGYAWINIKQESLV